MYNFITLKCCHCSSVIANLPEAEVKKLDGLTFRCDCCNHLNHLLGYSFVKCYDKTATSALNFV